MVDHFNFSGPCLSVGFSGVTTALLLSKSSYVPCSGAEQIPAGISALTGLLPRDGQAGASLTSSEVPRVVVEILVNALT